MRGSSGFLPFPGPSSGRCVEQILWRLCGISGRHLSDNDDNLGSAPCSAAEPGVFAEFVLPCCSCFPWGLPMCIAWVSYSDTQMLFSRVMRAMRMQYCTLLRLGMTLGQGTIGVWMLPGSPGLCQHSSLPARMRVTKVGLWKRVRIRKPGNWEHVRAVSALVCNMGCKAVEASCSQLAGTV